MRGVSLLLLFAAAIFLFRNWMGFRTVGGLSMEPSLHSGDLVFFVQTKGPLHYGDVVLIRREADQMAVKRVVGLSGDKIEVAANGFLTRNGQYVEEPYVHYGTQDNGEWICFPYIVPNGSVFCLGDNRALSLDSRVWGGTPLKDIQGKVVWSLHRFSSS